MMRSKNSAGTGRYTVLDWNSRANGSWNGIGQLAQRGLKSVRAGDLGRSARTDQRERHDPLRHSNRGAARDEGAVRMADENGAIDIERVEQPHESAAKPGIV